MTEPLYDPKTAFGNKELLKQCPEIKEEGEEVQKAQEIINWSAEPSEYSLYWTCVCGAKNEHIVDYEPESGDEVECSKCPRELILQ